MNKNIEWLKEKVQKRIDKLPRTYNGLYIDGSRDAYLLALKDINQLDEPEVLSQIWIDEHQQLQFYEANDTPYYFVRSTHLQNLLVPKQDVPVVPTWFDEWWKNVTKGGGNLFHNIERFYDELFSSGTRETYNYISDPDNKKKLLNIIINELEYEVEEEQKYYVINNDHRMMLVRMMDGKTITEADPFKLEDMYEVEKKSHRLTEQEIKDYDERYFAFAVKVEELEE